MGILAPTQFFWQGGGSIPTCGSAFISRYQSEILTHFSLCQNLFKNLKRKKNWKKKWGAGICGRVDSQKTDLIHDFFVYWPILAYDGSKCLPRWVLPYY